ncbi:GLPGLI family protein [Chryseobacterium ginsenosidimutans]|uniref:GLPGLI family protein n=1 Tax=Chryseobacterium ginsenosidimutans TaxID=687846 RepID=UPI00216A22D5|nr:GLPGLI family protein [Chryseobacterium ginsenosidimutans]MCS3869665.1 GLPGLI family protein [Chryseobacterium ginsenosidimutans]
MKLKYNLTALLLILSLGIVYAQNLTLSYELTYHPFDGDKKETQTQNYILDVVDGKSIFRTEMRRTSDSLLANGKFGMGYNINTLHELYLTKNIKESKINKVYVSPLSRDRFFISDFKKLDWKISPETVRIGEYNCQKAEVEYGGRHWIAWFTKDIPISEGPYLFHGLPGLIIQIKDDATDFDFKLAQLRKNINNSLYEAEEGKEISWVQFNNLLLDYFNNPMNMSALGGKKVMTDDGVGGYKPVNEREFTKKIQDNLIKNNNPIELTHKINYK